MSSSPALEPSSPSTTPSSPALRVDCVQFHTSTPNYIGRKQHQPPLNVTLPVTAPATPPNYTNDAAITPPPRSPGTAVTPASGDARSHPPDGTSSDKSSETAVGNISRPASTALSRKESYKAQRQHYSREKKRAATALLHSIEDPSVVVLHDWLKVRGSLKSWTKLWCVLKPGLLLLYKTPKAKSSHWVGTVLLTSCQVIERPSKKDGFCFKIYHPLEQSIWAPRGPHNESIGAVVQPLPTAHLIFRAPSQAAGHCWLDGLELALTCSNAMLRCSRSRPKQTVVAEAPTTQTNISHEELEKHFNEHVTTISERIHSSPVMSVSNYSQNQSRRQPKKSKHKPSKWAAFVESIEIMSKNSSTDSESEKKEGFLDFLWKRDLGRHTASTSCMRVTEGKVGKQLSKSLASSPISKRSHVTKCFELPKFSPSDKRRKCITPTIEDNLVKLISLTKRRSSTPSTKILSQKRISELRESGAKTDSENDDVFLKKLPRRTCVDSKIICSTPDNIIITETAPSLERFRRYTSSSDDDVFDVEYRKSPALSQLSSPMPEKYSLIDYGKLPSATFEADKSDRRDERVSLQNVYVAGKIVQRELAGAASDTDSEGSRGRMTTPRHVTRGKQDVLARIAATYVEDPDRDVGVAGELVEEVAEENKSLLWFLLKQVRPGMDLSKVVLPTFILEPRSFLDKLADSYYHADILSQAQKLDDPYKRFQCVLRWYLSGLYRKPKGLKKPYNPVLGETFRCCWKHANPDTYTYYIAEQVSHHPPVSAFYVSNRKDGYIIEGSLLARSKFYGNSTSAILEGCARVHLLQWGETYVTTAPYAHCKGIVIGTLSMELGGKVQVICESSGYQADVEFKLRSFLSGADQTNAISGRIKKGKETLATVEGYWDGRIDIKDKKTGEESNLLDVAVLKEQRLPRYLMKLENQSDFESQRLWIKVSEAIANDDQIAATEQKTIVEEAQRNRARNLAVTWVPKVFHRDPNVITPEGVIDQGWKYNHLNTSPWQTDEIIEYEDDFVIQSLRGNVAGVGAVTRAPSEPRPRESRVSDSDTHDDVPRAKLSTGAVVVGVPTQAHSESRPRHSRLSDSDTQDDVPRAKQSTRTLKQSLLAIDSALRDQSQAIERLSKTVEMLQGNRRTQNIGRVPNTTHSWDLFGGFILAVVLQAVLNWLFYKD